MQKSNEVYGAVSLWVGWANSMDALTTYADCDEPSRLTSTLASDFDTGWYDHDFMDMAVEKPRRSLSELLQGCSYDSIIIPKFVKLCGDVLSEAANAFVLLYDFQHHGSVGTESHVGGVVRLRYMGAIQVDVPWPD